jgi:hypothetical protein
MQSCDSARAVFVSAVMGFTTRSRLSTLPCPDNTVATELKKKKRISEIFVLRKDMAFFLVGSEYGFSIPQYWRKLYNFQIQ